MKKKGYIDFISAYCDRWCERCAFTSRCSAFAVEAAVAMCGDFQEGLQLAVGTPHPVDGTTWSEAPRAWSSSANDDSAAEDSSQDHGREMARGSRMDTPLMKSASAIAVVSHRWLADRAAAVRPAADARLQEALEIAAWDAAFVGAKLARALQGREDFARGEYDDDHPVQNDWNGSAKVALISLERCEAAWLTIARATGEATPGELAGQLADLRREVEQAFPNARSFIRPGFDEA
jgi:hypothetical protein